MPRETTFGKKQVMQLIEILKLKKTTSISFFEIIENISEYCPEHNKTKKQLRVTLNAYRDLFKDAGIEIYKYEDQNREQGIEYIRKTLLHFKNSLGKAIITGVELQEYLKDTYDFKLHLNTPFLSNYKVNEYMREFKMSFTNSNVQRSTTFGLIKKFSNSKKVAQYKKNKKTFTIPELHKYMLDEKLNISVATLYNYSNEILQLGIPININKMIINQSKYGEKDIINKLCSNILKKGINKIYAGQLSKISRQLSLPNLGYKKILEYQKYIQKIYDIEVVDFQKSIIEKEKILNTIEENHKCLNTLASPSIVVVELLPSFHDVESDILVLQGIEIELKELWVEYLKLYIKNLSVNRVAVRNELIDAESNLTIDTENKKIFFLYHNDLNIQNLTIEDIIKLSKKEVLSKDKLYGIHRQNMFIGFLIYLYTKGCLLISFDFLYHNYYKNKKAQTEIDIFLQDTFFYKKFEKIEKENRLNSKETKEKRFFLFFLLSINKDTNLGNVTEDYFYSVDNIDSKKSKILKKVFNKLGTNINITSGNLLYTKDYYSYMKKSNFNDFIIICNTYMDKKVKLKQTKTPKSYYRHTSSKICKFLEFVDQYHKGLKLTKENLQLLLDYPESKSYTYQEFLESLTLDDSTKSTRLNIFVEIFANTKGYEGVCTKEKIPKYNTNSNGSRKAIEDDEIIHKIDDIVTNRPPKSDYFKNHKVTMDMDWWKHLDRVRPFEPLLIKTHLRIPVRGDSLRKIDRDKLLQKNNANEIKGFYFISDKNKNRREPFIVPNIWKSDLNYLEKLVEYNKLYFPNMKKFNPDDTTIKDGILPLFPNQDGTSNYSNGQHLHYWTKVLILAQMEFEQEGKNYNLVYSDEIELPLNIEEFDNLTSQEIKMFKRKYDIHTLRHTGITRNIRAGMPLELVRLLSGHSGFNTILTIYYHVNQEEMVQDWLNKYNMDIDTELDMHKASQLFINKEMLDVGFDSVNDKQILTILVENNFFNPQNRTLAIKDNITLESISKSDPKFWIPVNGGICTKQKCPDDILGRCSLCPYFITNYRFTHDLGLNMQMSMARVKKYSDMVIKNREVNKNSENKKLRKMMDYEIEDFIAWLEVLSLAKESYNELQEENIKEDNAVTSNVNIKEKHIFDIVPALNIDHGYLEILSQTFKKNVYDNETVVDITNKIANKIIRYHAKSGTYSDIEHLDNEAIVKSFLPKYEQHSNDWLENSESQRQIEYLLNQLDDKNKKLEYKNEDTFLTSGN